MKRQFVDTDDEIVSRAGRPIPEIFANEGEGRFRAWERAVLEDVCQRAIWWFPRVEEWYWTPIIET